MLKVGLTGGIGSGKTTVATIFEVLGIPVYYADSAARRIMKENESLKASIVKYFGEQAYIKDELNRSWLASIVFNDRHKLDMLNFIRSSCDHTGCGNLDEPAENTIRNKRSRFAFRN